jgi:ubiquinol-cytochrome c reductase cytochrome c1 subunit
VGEPTKTTRLSLGRWVLGFLVVYFVLMFLLKKEYWKAVK